MLRGTIISLCHFTNLISCLRRKFSGPLTPVLYNMSFIRLVTGFLREPLPMRQRASSQERVFWSPMVRSFLYCRNTQLIPSSRWSSKAQKNHESCLWSCSASNIFTCLPPFSSSSKRVKKSHAVSGFSCFPLALTEVEGHDSIRR